MTQRINAASNIQILSIIAAVKVKRYGTWTQRETQSAVEVGIMKNIRNIFILTYVNQLNNGTMYHYIRTITDNESAERVLLVTYEAPLNVDQHTWGTLDIIKKEELKFRQESISITIFTE